MNTTYLLITLLVAVVAVIGWATCSYASNTTLGGFGLVAGVAGSMATFALFILSFGCTMGNPIVQETAAFRVEKTPYRVVVSAFGREVTLTDARSVAHADQIEKVRLITHRNAWGITHEVGPAPTLQVLFREPLTPLEAK